MKKYRITYQPYPTSDVTSSDVVVRAMTPEDAQKTFQSIYPLWGFVSAKEEM